MAQNPTFVITMADGREMKGELYPETAPQSVGNFIALANSGFYDGLIFHRVIPGFMIQGGDPKGTGIGGPGYHIKGEFAMNGVNNPLKHTYGVLSMARSMMPDSAGSQFFIMTSDSPHLDGQYAAFGKVLEGMDVADAIILIWESYNVAGADAAETAGLRLYFVGAKTWRSRKRRFGWQGRTTPLFRRIRRNI